MKNGRRGILLVIIGALAVIVMILRPGRVPIPPVFAEHLTLGQAMARSGQSGKPVLVFATADWCGPCSEFKRTTLADPEVARWIGENTVPVYLNVDQFQDEAGVLSIISIPTSIVVRAGQPGARISGAVGAEQYLSWLKAAAGPNPG